MSSPMYIAEISPARIRGRMVSVNQFAIVTGFLVVYFVNYFIALQGDAIWNEQSGWRWMFGSETLPALLLLVLLFFVPESPRWLTKQKREDEALEILSRVDGAEYAKTELSEIKDALTHESGSLRQLFQPRMKIVLVIGIVLAVFAAGNGYQRFPLLRDGDIQEDGVRNQRRPSSDCNRRCCEPLPLLPSGRLISLGESP